MQMTVNTTNSVAEFDTNGVNTLSDLRAVNSALNNRAATLGYAARGDGGHGEYAVDEADTTSTESIPMIIVANDGARWKLIHDGNVSAEQDRKSTRLNSSHITISYAVFCLK